MKRQFHLAWWGEVGRTAKPLHLAIDEYAQQVRMIEHAGVEMVVLGAEEQLSFSPGVIAGALAPRVGDIGLVPHLCVDDYPPYKLARLMSTLDNVAVGSIGWDIGVGGAGEGRADYWLTKEYLDVCRKLWASWAPGALIEDTGSGIFADAAKVRPINHRGEHFQVAGPLNTVPLRGAPLLVMQAAGDEGLEFAGEQADLVVVGGRSSEEIGAAVASVRESARAAGRAERDVSVYLDVEIAVDEARSHVSITGSATGGVVLAGRYADVASQLAGMVDATLVDGVLIRGRWDPVHTTITCTQVLGTLRRDGRLKQRSQRAVGLRERLIG